MKVKYQIKSIANRVRDFSNRIVLAGRIAAGRSVDPMDVYSSQAPHPQNIVNLFQGQWASRFPVPHNDLKAGEIELFDDARMYWALETIGNVKGKRVLELGPLEGGHAYILQKHGASVVSIEANPRAYLKCLAVKEILRLNQVEFLFGDFTKYLQSDIVPFDLCIACGVLYHMRHPVELIAQIAEKSSEMFMWTHYYDPVICRENHRISYNFNGHSQHEHKGFKHTLHQHNYGIRGKRFFGGPAAYSNWLSRDDIINACRHFGFKRVEISSEHDTPDHPHGPAFAFIASKK